MNKRDLEEVSSCNIFIVKVSLFLNYSFNCNDQIDKIMKQYGEKVQTFIDNVVIVILT